MSNLLKVIVCDDEASARLLLTQYLSAFPQLQLLQECTNGPEAVTAINQLEPDLIFLDIQMPGLSGFQVLQNIVHIPQVIFSTAYDQYALKAFDSNAVDYLLKPYTRDRFNQAVNKVLLNNGSNKKGIQQLNQQLQTEQFTYPEKVLVESGNRLIAIETNQIIWIEAEGDYTKLHCNDRSYLSNFGIGTLEQKLHPQLFTRIHRSAIINITTIKEVYRDNAGYFVQLQNSKTHKVGRNYVENIKKISW